MLFGFTTTQLTYLIYGLVFSVLFLLFLFKTREFQQRDFYPLFLALMLGIIHNFSRLGLELGVQDNKSQLFQSLDMVLDLVFLMEQYLLLLFVERIQHLNINRMKITVLSFFAGITFTADLAMVFTGYTAFLTRLTFIGMNISVLIVFGLISYNFYQIYVVSKDKSAIIQFIASLLIFVSYIVFTSVDMMYLYELFDSTAELTASISLLIQLGQITTISGLLTFILVFLFNPDIIYRSQINIQDLVVFATSGLAVYGIGQNVEETSLDTQLLSGFITAMNNFVEELHPKYPGEMIKLFQSTERSIDVRIGNDVGVAIITRQRTYILKQKLIEFIRLLELQLVPGEIIIQKLDDKMVRSILKKVFPYLNVDQMQTY